MSLGYQYTFNVPPAVLGALVATPSAAITGTGAAGITEAEIVAGGETIIITLTGDTWVPDDGTFAGIRQDIIDGLAGSGGDTTDQLQDGLAVTDVVRTDDNTVTITASAIPGYDVASTATYEWTIPASSVVGGSPIVATPTFNVTAVGAGNPLLLRLMQEGLFVGDNGMM